MATRNSKIEAARAEFEARKAAEAQTAQAEAQAATAAAFTAADAEYNAAHAAPFFAEDEGPAPTTFGAMLRKLNDHKRRIVALVANIVTIGAGLYVGSMITVIVTNMAIALTGSAFLAWMAYFIGSVLTWLASLAAGFLVQNMLLEGGLADKVAGKVGDWFKRDPKPVAQPC